MDPESRRTGIDLADVVLGVGAPTWRIARWASRPLRGVVGELLDVVVSTANTAGVLERGARARAELERAAVAALQVLTVHGVEIVLAALDLTEIVRRNVDLDALVAGVDLNAVVRRVDLDAAAAGLDIDRLVGEVDLDAVVSRVDLDAAVRRVDLNAVVGLVDLNAVVRRVDLDAVVGLVDLDAAVRRVDVVRIAREVIAAIDLPEIVRDSTGALSSDAVRTVRAEGMQADDMLAAFVDRVLRRRPRPEPEPVVP
jgi:hypothetical protein